MNEVSWEKLEELIQKRIAADRDATFAKNAEVNKLKDALLWYAECDICVKSIIRDGVAAIDHDHGRRAREALGLPCGEEK